MKPLDRKDDEFKRKVEDKQRDRASIAVCSQSKLTDVLGAIFFFVINTRAHTHTYVVIELDTKPRVYAR